MAFGRRPTGAEREAATAAAQSSPNQVNLPGRGVIRLRQSMLMVSKQTARELMRMRQLLDQVGLSEVEAELGPADYADMVADFNTLRAAVLQASPSLADQVPDEL